MATVRYVDVSNSTPAPPYTSWATAATAIQDAIDASSDGDEIWVTNGVYNTGGAVTPGFYLQCRVVLNKAVTVRSVNGPAATVIVGSGPIGFSAVRCAYLTNGAELAGFTLSNGHTRYDGYYSFDQSGAGALLHAGGVLSNCVVADNVAYGDDWRGGAVHCFWGGDVVDCRIERNVTTNGAGGGVNCWYGGTVRSSRIVNNRAHASGGGVYCYRGGVIVDSLVSNNVAAEQGGGIWVYKTGVVDRCVVACNVALTNSGGGVVAHYGGLVMNAIIHGNIAFTPDQYTGGGGAFIGWGGIISNCVVFGNRCTSVGGGLRVLYDGSRAVNCAVYGNYAAMRGGGVDLSAALLLNCSVFNNRAGASAGGVYFSNTSLAGNSIIYHNRAPLCENAEFINTTYQPPTNVNCCLYPAPPSYAVTFNVITNDHVLLGMSNPHIATNSPCIDAGSNAQAFGVDIDYEPRIIGGTVDIGCDEVVPAGLTGALAAAIYAPYTVVVANVAAPFYADVQVKASLLEWEIDTNGGVRVVNNAGAVQQAWPVPGVFPVILRAWNNDGMAAATVMVQVVSAFTNYAAHGGAHIPPFMSLADAATSIVAALEAVPPGGVTVVSNGVYAEETTIALDKPVTLISLAGRDETVINGQGVRRCVLLAHAGAVVQALTISNGFLNTENGAGVYAVAGTVERCALVNNTAYSGSAALLQPGAVMTGVYVRANMATRSSSQAGAVYCDGGGLVLGSAIISNISTASSGDGGGLVFNYGGTAAYCLVAGNRADDGAGAYCNYGGELLNCVITGNMAAAAASSAGGGVYGYYGGVLRNCVIMHNRANGNGGGVRHFNGGRLVNCTIMNNHALGNGGGYYSSGFVLENCIVYYNRAAAYPDWYHASATFARRYSCVTPLLPQDEQCFDASPCLAGVNNPHLMAASPCLNAGSNDAAAGIVVDVDTEPRIDNAIVDVGCDEYHPAGITGELSVAILTDYTNAVMGAPLQFRADVRGKAQGLVWRIATGSGDAVISNQTVTSYAWSAPGSYDVALFAWNATHSAAATITVTMVAGFTNYVNYANATPSAPYTSWATAATNIVDAVAAAAAGGVTLVNTGVYREPATINVSMPLRLEGVGGADQVIINGAGERRGLLTGTGGGVFISGFTFSNCAAADGAGIYCHAGDTVSNCAFVRNVATGAGGGIYMGGAQVMDCTFYTNSAANGGGVYLNGGTLARCTFINNLASFTSGYGGGAYMNGGSVLACAFYTNLARYGGGAYLYYGSEIRDTWFVGNIATATTSTTTEGGGLNSMSTPVISNCHFLYNIAARTDCYGGGAHVRYATLWDCSFTGNRANFGGGAELFSCTAAHLIAVSNRMTGAAWDARGAGLRLRSTTLRDSFAHDNNAVNGTGGGIAAQQNSIVSNCVCTSNTAGAWNGGGGVYAEDNAVIVNCQISENHARYSGGGATINSATLRQCLVVSNTAGEGNGGGGVVIFNGSTVERCYIAANATAMDGGGALVWGGGSLINCYIADNVATNRGGGVYMDDWTANGVIEHCTIVNNIGIERGGGVCLFEGGLVRNSIVMDNLAARDSNVSLDSGTFAEYCCSAPAPPGPGNFNAAPLLAGAGNPHLLPGSPCIDAGTNTGLAAIDIDLEPRPNGARVDVGCDELWSSGLTGALAVAIDAPFSNVVVNAAVPFNAIVQGKPHTLVWQFHTDGGVDLVSNLWSASYAWSTTGAFPVICSVFNNDSSASATTMVEVTLPVTNYVSPLGAHQYPFDSWAKAATQIVAAVEAAAAGGCVLVSNGTYVAPQGVLIWEKPVTITSLAGWQETIVDGQKARRGFIVLDTETLIEGFTIINGYAPDDVFSGAGAGVILYKRGTVRNCVFLNNRALQYGGGVMCMEGGRVENCFFSGNQAQFGGGALCYGGGTVVNCTMQRNRALIQGGGVFCQDGGTVQNSIMYHNLAGIGPNFWNQGSGMVYAACCTWPHPGDDASFTNAPMLAGIANPHLLTNSPCINAGSNICAASIARDIDDEPRITGGRVDIGCDELLVSNLYGLLSAAIVATRTNTTVGFALPFQADVRGKVRGLVWNIQMPGGPPAQVFNQADLSWAWLQTGVYEVVLQAYNDSMSAAATVTVSVIEAFTNYVSKSGGAIWPYDSWDNAATCILDAVEAAVPGNLILVANGTYYERAEVLLDIPVTLRSENPLGATIHGQWRRRCARIDHPDAVIDGFYLYRGNPTNSAGGEGGGVVLNGGGTVMNCTIQDNRSPTYGAGALLYGGGVVTNCQLVNNGGVGGVSYGAGAALFNGGKVVDCLLRWNEASQRGGAVICYFDGLVQRCRIYNNRCGGEGGGVAFHEGGQVVECDIAVNEANEGGGAHYYQGGIIERCAISNNLGYSQGGGVKFYAGGLLRNSLVWRNDAPWGGYGGGVMIRYAGTVESCTIAGNSAATSGNGGLYCNPGGTVRNSIIYHNVGNNVTAPEQGSFTHCCAPIALAGAGNITNDPLFINVAAGNCRLDYLTPCLNAGVNQPWMSSATDLDGQPRIISGTVDMGCYETSYGTQAPFLDITETNTAIAYFLTTITIGGTNNNHVIGTMWISNATAGGAAVPFMPARHWRSSAIGVAYGTNTLVVYGSNFLNAVVSDTIDVTRAYPGADAPFVWITTMPQTVSYDLNSMTIAGTNNANVVGGMWLLNAANGAVVEMPAQLSWSAALALVVGDNQITAYGTNAAGVLAYSHVTITRGGIGTGAPFVDITNASPRVVSYGAATATIGGTNNAHVMGVIRWVNTTGGTSGSATRAGDAWTALITGLLHGDNAVQVIGTNLLAQQSMDTITVHRKTAAESLPQIASNVLIFPSHAAVLNAPLPTNVIWLVSGITDDDDGTNVTISAMTVHVSNTLAQVAVVTNNISNVHGWCPWLVPESLIGAGTTYVMRFEVVDSNGLTNSMIFRGNVFTVVPEAALGLLLFCGMGLLCTRR